MEAPCYLYYEGRLSSTGLYYEERSLFGDELLRERFLPPMTIVLRGAIPAAGGSDVLSDDLIFFEPCRKTLIATA